MALFTTTPAGFDDDLREFDSVKEYRVRIDPAGTPTDLTALLDNNSITISHREGSGAQATIELRNSGGDFDEGDYADSAIGIDARVNSSSWIEVFYGWVDEKGAKLEIGVGKAARAVLQCTTLEKRYGTRQKLSNLVLSSWTVCDTASPSTSIVHKLAELMGLGESDLDVGDIEYTVDWVSLGKRAPWQELRDLADLYRATLYPTASGKLRIRSPLFETTPPTLSVEWSFANDDSTFSPNIRDLKSAAQGEYVPKSCNRGTCAFDDYEALGTGRVIWRSVEGYDDVTHRIGIVLEDGESWPVLDNDAAPAKLSYVDPATGESIPYATDVITPTAGYYGSGSDIESVGGVVTVVSFNGSTGATKLSPDHSEIILRNDSGDQIVIYKFEVRGTGYRVKAAHEVVYEDAAVSDDEDFIDKTLPGVYAANETQVYVALQNLVHQGKGGRRRWSFVTHWLPQVQLEARVEFRKPGDDYVTCRVVGYQHLAPGGVMAKVETRLEIEEVETFSPSGSPTPAIDVPGVSNPGPSYEEYDEAIAEVPTYTEIVTGFNAGGGTTTPTVPTPVVLSAELGIALSCDRQADLTNFVRYEWQVSVDGGTTARTPAFDGTGIGSIGGDYDAPVEFWVHRPLPLDGDADDPSAKTWHYRVRRVGQSATSAWSSWTSGQSLPVGAGALAGESVYANNMVTGFLQALFAQITELAVGYLGSGSFASPDEGDYSLVLDEARMYLQRYLNGGWSDVNKITFGVLVGSALLAFMGCRGITHPEVDPPGEVIPSENFHVLRFEDDYTDQYGVAPDTETDAARSAAWAKFGTYSLFADDGYQGVLEYGDTLALDAPFGSCAWISMTGTPTGTFTPTVIAQYIVQSTPTYEAVSVLCGYDHTNQRVLAQFIEYSGGGPAIQVASAAIAMSFATFSSQDRFVGFILDPDARTISLICDDTIDTQSYDPLTVSGASISNFFSVRSCQNYYGVDLYQDDVLFAYDDKCDIDLFVQHYLSGEAWITDLTYKDLILQPASGGRVMLPVEGEWREAGIGIIETSGDEDAGYRLDSSGYCHVWKRVSLTSFAITTADNGVYHSDVQAAEDYGVTFRAVPNCRISVGGRISWGAFYGDAEATITAWPRYEVVRASSAASTSLVVLLEAEGWIE